MINLYDILSIISIQNFIIIKTSKEEYDFDDPEDAINELEKINNDLLSDTPCFMEALEGYGMYIEMERWKNND